jgi:hypothetical protein
MTEAGCQLINVASEHFVGKKMSYILAPRFVLIPMLSTW